MKPNVVELQREQIVKLELQLSRAYERMGADAQVIHSLTHCLHWCTDDSFRGYMQDPKFVSQFVTYYLENNERA